MSLTPLKYLKFLIFVKLLILRYQFIGITLSKPHLVCTFYDKQINAKKYEWKFGSVQILLVGDCTMTSGRNNKSLNIIILLIGNLCMHGDIRGISISLLLLHHKHLYKNYLDKNYKTILNKLHS